MGKLIGEFREPNRKDKVTRFPSVTFARQLELLVNTLGSHLKSPLFFNSAPCINRKGRKKIVLLLCGSEVQAT